MHIYQMKWTLSVLLKFTITLACCMLLTSSSIVEGRQVALPGPQCHPSIIHTMPPRIRQICKALETIWEFNDTMEDYLDEKDDYAATRIARASPMLGVAASPSVFPRAPTPPQAIQAQLSPEEAAARRHGWSSGVKRQSSEPFRRRSNPKTLGDSAPGNDYDHVFLRFGKRG